MKGHILQKRWMAQNEVSPLFLVNPAIMLCICFRKSLKKSKKSNVEIIQVNFQKERKRLLRFLYTTRNVTGESGSTLSIILSITSSDRFMPDSASVATTICFTYKKRKKKKRKSLIKIRLVLNEKQKLRIRSKKSKYLLPFNKTLLLQIIQLKRN